MYKWISKYITVEDDKLLGLNMDGLEGPGFTNPPGTVIWKTGIIVEKYTNEYNVEFAVVMDEKGIKEVVLFTNLKLIK
jgi:hypothetical protein